MEMEEPAARAAEAEAATAPAPALEEVEERAYEGRVGGFLRDEQYTLRLRLYGDGTLDGDVWQRPPRPLHGRGIWSTATSRKRPRMDAGVDTDTGTDTATAAATATSAELLCAFLQGRWVSQATDHTKSTSDVDESCEACEFQVMKRAGHVDRHTMLCRVDLLATGVAVGAWMWLRDAGGVTTAPVGMPPLSASLANTMPTGSVVIKQEVTTDNNSSCTSSNTGTSGDLTEPACNTFAWRRILQPGEPDAVAAVNGTTAPPDPLALYPLGPGTYRFRGFTISSLTAPPVRRPRRRRRGANRALEERQPEPPVREHCLVNMELRPDGSLHGSSREVVYPQSCRISGTWELGRLRYALEYRVRDAVAHFAYSGRVEVVEPVSIAHEPVVRVVKKEEEKKGEGEKEEEVRTRQLRRRRVITGRWRIVEGGEVLTEEEEEGEAKQDQGQDHEEEEKEGERRVRAAPTPGYDGGRGTFELECVHATRMVKPELMTNASGAAVVTNEAIPHTVLDGASTGGEANSIHSSRGGALTTGRYTLTGKAMDEDGYEYECQLDMELLPSGALRGTCRERVYSQEQLIHGEWTRRGFVYRQDFVVHRQVGTYIYSGTLDGDGLVVAGSWCNAEFLGDTEEERQQQQDHQQQQGSASRQGHGHREDLVKKAMRRKRRHSASASRGEQGTFAYAIVHVQRRWSAQSHADFSPSCRARVRCVLLCSQRHHLLPSALWHRIFAFCGVDDGEEDDGVVG